MAARPKFYSRHIATGSGILVFSILFAAIIRILYFLDFGIENTEEHNSLLWGYFTPLFENPYVSFIGSSITVGILAFMASHIDTKHLLIRKKTYLPAVFIILLFSSHPYFLAMSGEFVSITLMLIMLSTLFSSYSIPQKQHATFRISFILAISGLFSTASLLYLPLLWLGLGIMRLLNFKALMTSVLGVFIVYFPVFSYFLLTDGLHQFLTPFQNLSTLFQLPPPLFTFEVRDWIALGFSSFLLLITASDDFVNRHKDKIKVRNYFNLLILVCFFSILGFMLVNINPLLHLFIAFIAGAFILAHFFALVERKISAILFYVFLLLFIALCISPFLSFY